MWQMQAQSWRVLCRSLQVTNLKLLFVTSVCPQDFKSICNHFMADLDVLSGAGPLAMNDLRVVKCKEWCKLRVQSSWGGTPKARCEWTQMNGWMNWIGNWLGTSVPCSHGGVGEAHIHFANCLEIWRSQLPNEDIHLFHLICACSISCNSRLGWIHWLKCTS